MWLTLDLSVFLAASVSHHWPANGDFCYFPTSLFISGSDASCQFCTCSRISTLALANLISECLSLRRPPLLCTHLQVPKILPAMLLETLPAAMLNAPALQYLEEFARCTHGNYRPSAADGFQACKRRLRTFRGSYAGALANTCPHFQCSPRRHPQQLNRQVTLLPVSCFTLVLSSCSY